MGQNMHAAKPHVALAVANAIFGVGNIVSKLGLHHVNPLMFALIREVISGPLLLLLSLIARRWQPDDRTAPELIHLRQFIIIGISLFGSNACYIVGVKLGGATCSAVWQSAQPVFITLFAVLVRYESCTLCKAAGIAVACGGCAFVTLYRSQGAGQAATNRDLLIGNGLFLLQMVCISIFYVGQVT